MLDPSNQISAMYKMPNVNARAEPIDTTAEPAIAIASLNLFHAVFRPIQMANTTIKPQMIPTDKKRQVSVQKTKVRLRAKNDLELSR